MVTSLFYPFFAKSALKKPKFRFSMVKITFFITIFLILLDVIDLESYLHCGTFAKNRMSVRIYSHS